MSFFFLETIIHSSSHKSCNNKLVDVTSFADFFALCWLSCIFASLENYSGNMSKATIFEQISRNVCTMCVPHLWFYILHIKTFFLNNISKDLWIFVFLKEAKRVQKILFNLHLFCVLLYCTFEEKFLKNYEYLGFV